MSWRLRIKRKSTSNAGHSTQNAGVSDLAQGRSAKSRSISEELEGRSRMELIKSVRMLLESKGEEEKESDEDDEGGPNTAFC